MIANERGVSLLELLVAFAILAVAAAGLFSVTSMAALGNNRNNDRIAATTLAVDKLEELAALGFSDLAAGAFADPQPIQPSGDAGGIFTRSWTITNTTVAGASAKAISVTVAATGGETVTLSTQRVETSYIASGFATAFPSVANRGWSQTR